MRTIKNFFGLVVWTAIVCVRALLFPDTQKGMRILWMSFALALVGLPFVLFHFGVPILAILGIYVALYGIAMWKNRKGPKIGL